MAIVQCENQHYYDDEKFPECPHCVMQAKKGDAGQESVTVALARESREVENYAVEYIKQSSPKVYIHVEPAQEQQKEASTGEKPGVPRCVAGWLVCVREAEYGSGFPLYAGFNRIGRASGNDIILNDPQASREEHCSVIYEEKRNVFYLFPKDGNLTYLGEELAGQAQEIRHGQIITIGGTQLQFVAFCMGETKWEKNR